MADKAAKNRDDVDSLVNDIVAPAAPAGGGEEKRPARKPGGGNTGPRGGGQQSRGGYRGGQGDADGGRGGPGGKRGGYFQGRRRVCPIKYEEVDWKNMDSLRYFVSDDGSIRPRRKTGANAKLQRKVAVMVKRARHMALLPYTGEHVRLSGSGRR